ncbi:MAG: hypothetical protein GY765_42560 [bacterium]|nr:hypothetical protein [bacterium]
MLEEALVFYGVRGSYPVPHKSVSKYGGNTASILLDLRDKIIILDAGTGIVRLGNYIKSWKPHIKTIDLFLTHLHIDHIQGIPFFDPVFDESFVINIYCDSSDETPLKDTIYSLFNQPLSPISVSGIKAQLNFITLDTLNPKFIAIAENATIRYFKEDTHPLSGVLVYKLEFTDKTIIYATDVETPDGFDGPLLDFVKGADVMIHDCQYVDSDYFSRSNSRKGYGHSTVTMAAANALKCQVKKLYLFHYGPGYSDSDVEKMLKEARKIFKNTYLSKEYKKIIIRR